MLAGWKSNIFIFISILSLCIKADTLSINSVLGNSSNESMMTIDSVLSGEDSMFDSSFNISEVLERGGEGSVIDYGENSPQEEIATIHSNTHNDKVIYLTFDDGPMRGTKNLLDVLTEEKIDATMFVVASNVVRNIKYFKRELTTPNLMVANHTYSHASGHYAKFYRNRYGVLADVEHAQLVIGGRQYLRLAGRNVWRIPSAKKDDRGIKKRQRRIEKRDYDALAKDGFFIYGWDVEWHFDRRGKMTTDAQKLADRIEAVYKRGRTIKKGKVVLLAHDFMFRTKESVSELRKFIKILKNRGWRFEKIDKYEDIQPTELKVARYYKPSRLKVADLRVVKERKRLAMITKNREIYKKSDSLKITDIVSIKTESIYQSDYQKEIPQTAYSATDTNELSALLYQKTFQSILNNRYKEYNIEKYLVNRDLFKFKDYKFVAKLN